MKPPGTDTRLPWGLTWRLATGQIVAWGTLYYAFTVVTRPLQAETGWGQAFVHGGVSLGLLAWGLGAFPVGWWIQRHGARGLMTVASVLGGGALAMLGIAASKGVYLAAWVVLGLSMAGVLYEPAFAVVVEHFGSRYRRGIMLVTLVGGFASTVFLPVAHAAVDRFGWRGALVGLAALHVAFCAPIHAFGIPARVRPTGPGATGASPPVFSAIKPVWRAWRRDMLDTRVVGLAIWFSAQAAALSGLIFILVPILHDARVPSGVMLQALALIGPMQVLGRLALAAAGDRFSMLRVGLWATLLLGVSLLALMELPSSRITLSVFAVLFGLGNGMMTVLRGTAVAELFGRERYAELNSVILLPSVLARAASPIALATLWTTTGSPKAAFAGSLVLLALSAVGLGIVRRANTSAAGFGSPDSEQGIDPVTNGGFQAR